MLMGVGNFQSCKFLMFSFPSFPNFNFQFQIFNFHISMSGSNFQFCEVSHVKSPSSIFWKSNISDFQNFKHNKVNKLGTQTLQHFQNFRFSETKNNHSQRRSHISYIFWSILVINRGSEGPDFVTFLLVPKMFQEVLQSIRNHYLAIWGNN